ncbi:class I SAM-dependent methyltransferase [Halobacillus amylolyticus]|uniref:Class I SAM-dependent methyltransferase n=1 Tax=Halobacillus amylolyticus TaxID=2932259 RepID=A0ABY4HDB8_9BACI|nr:class I SAM-dependent methyltransferase [Halobacillus amylolyticus]UOR12847.1 class I SAM-dependent methyltransferase [Halobacillus amylolyticus]
MCTNPIYNNIGKTYNSTRRADPRITQRIVEELNVKTPATILDIGAGTGNYSCKLAERGYSVIAMEPSEVMRNQGEDHQNLTWKEGIAEDIPIPNKSVDGIVCTLASHHFKDLRLAFSEMKRVLRDNGKIIIFTLDPRLCADDFWLFEYFSPILEEAYNIHPPIHTLSNLLEEVRGPVEVKPFALPNDLEDQFFFSGWNNPELYFEESFKNGTSSLAKGNSKTVSSCLNRLREDLESGKWQRKYGDLLHLKNYECGHFFLVI